MLIYSLSVANCQFPHYTFVKYAKLWEAKKIAKRGGFGGAMGYLSELFEAFEPFCEMRASTANHGQADSFCCLRPDDGFVACVCWQPFHDSF